MDPLSRARPETRVVVVGAGLAGLAAAWRLTERGLSVVVLESERRAGGRAAGIPLQGATVDPVGFRVTLADQGLLELVAAAGGAKTLLPLRPLASAQVHGGRSVRIEPSGLLQVASLPGVPLREALRLPRLGRLIRGRYRALLDPRAPERAAPLDDRSVADFGRLYFGRRVVERWMEPELADHGIAGAEATSRVAFLLQQPHEHWFGPATLRGALQQLVESLTERLEVRVSSSVERIEPRSTGGYDVRVRETGRLETLDADAVVVATPADEAARLAAPALTGYERSTLADVRYGPRIVARVGAARPLERVATRIRVPLAEGSPFAVLQLEPSGVPGTPPDGMGFVYAMARETWSAAHLEAPVESVGKELAGALVQLLAASRPELRGVQVQRYPRALPTFEVGRYRELARLRRVSEELRESGRRLYLAGDYLAAPSLGGAVVSGFRAAEDLEADWRIGAYGSVSRGA